MSDELENQAPEAGSSLDPANDFMAAFTSIMDTVPEEPGGTSADEGAEAAGSDSADAGSAAATPVVAGTVGAGAGVPAGGAGSVDGVPENGTGGGQSGAEPPAIPADWTDSAADVAPRIASLSEKIERNTLAGLQSEALASVKEDFGNYFDAIEKHPRMLVGTQVPSLNGGEGEMETLRDSADAKEWQEAVKDLLVEEVKSRVSAAREEYSGAGDQLVASVEIFTRNHDLIPHTKDFDLELATRFTRLAKPYENRVDGKLIGYTVPVQGLIDQVREQLAEERTARPATPAAAPPASPVNTPSSVQAPAVPAPEPPQAGIPSSAGNSGGEAEDFSTLFKAAGFPSMQV